MKVISIIFLFIGLFVFCELLRKQLKITAEHTRKISHIISGVFVFFLPYVVTYQEMIILGLFFIGFLLITQRFRLLPSIHNVSRRTIGEVFYPAGILLAVLFLWQKSIIAFQFGVLILTIADAVAEFIGKNFGKHSYQALGGFKTVEGSIAFFIVSIVIYTCILLLKTDLNLAEIMFTSVITGILLTFVEGMLGWGLDNLFLPSVSGLLLYYLIFLVHVQ